MINPRAGAAGVLTSDATCDRISGNRAFYSFLLDVALLDLGMPNRSGYEVCRYIREQPWGKNIVLIALTGWGRDDDRRKSTESGFDHHIVKPLKWTHC